MFKNVSSWLKNTLGGAFASAGSYDATTEDFYYTPIAGQSLSGHGAMAISTVYACVTLISNSVADLPIKVYKKAGDAKEPLLEHKLAQMLNAPNEHNTGYEFFKTMVASLLLTGNAFYLKTATGLEYLPTASVSVSELPSTGRFSFTVAGTSGGVTETKTYSQEEIFRVHNLNLDGKVLGISPIEANRKLLEFTQEASEYGNSVFRNGAFPSCVLESVGDMGQERADELARQFAKKNAGARNHGRPAVLRGGVTIKQLGLKPLDLQFLQTKQLNDREIARIFLVPPRMIGIEEEQAAQSVTEQGIQFVTQTIRPLVACIEAAIKRDLILEENVYVEFNLKGLLRGSFGTQAQGYALALTHGFMSVNEVRSLENLPPIPSGDAYLRPLNMEEAGERAREKRKKEEATDDND